MIKVQLQHRYTTKEPGPAITGPALGKVPLMKECIFHYPELADGKGAGWGTGIRTPTS
jgi:hypothetical protein